MAMCRNIKRLNTPDQPPTEEEIALAALQYVRKISGYRVPSKANQAAFNQAVEEIAAASSRLIGKLSYRQVSLAHKHVGEEAKA
jgi:hypothetical protein